MMNILPAGHWFSIYAELEVLAGSGHRNIQKVEGAVCFMFDGESKPGIKVVEPVAYVINDVGVSDDDGIIDVSSV